MNTRNRTQVIKKSSEPNWQCTFDLSLISLLSYNHKKSTKRQWNQGIIITICSKDRFRSQFLGQIQLPFTDVEEEDELLYDCINNQVSWRVSLCLSSSGILILGLIRRIGIHSIVETVAEKYHNYRQNQLEQLE